MRLMVRVNYPSPLQKRFFGDTAFRPYLLIITDEILDDYEIVGIIKLSMFNQPVEGVVYRKYFELEPGTYEFDYCFVATSGMSRSYPLGLLEV